MQKIITVLSWLVPVSQVVVLILRAFGFIHWNLLQLLTPLWGAIAFLIFLRFYVALGMAIWNAGSKEVK